MKTLWLIAKLNNAGLEALLQQESDLFTLQTTEQDCTKTLPNTTTIGF
jgi:hypothetical protein